MKKLLCIVLCLLCVASLAACGGGEGKTPAASAGLQVGFDRESVMPDVVEDVHLGGDDDAFRKATGFIDILAVTCIALKDGSGEPVLMYTVDFNNSKDAWVSPIRTAISQETGVPENRILVAATHTHSGVSMSYEFKGAAQYKQKVQDAMVKAAKDALADLGGCQIYYGSTEAGDLLNVRHYRMADGSVKSSGLTRDDPDIIEHPAQDDGELQVVRLDREEGKKDVVLVCFNPHTTFNGNVKKTDLSADFPGPMREYIEAQGDYQAAYFIGDGGNQAPTSYLSEDDHGFNDYRSYGQELGRRVVELLPSLKKSESSGLSVNSRTFTGTTNKEKLDLLPQAKEVVAVHEAQGREASEELAAQYGIYQRVEAYAIVRRANAPATRSMNLTVMALGDELSFLFAPYEMFSESGSAIRAQTPYGMTFLATCANGSHGYLPSLAASEYGCYESYTTNFARGTAEELVETYLDMLTKLKNGETETAGEVAADPDE